MTPNHRWEELDARMKRDGFAELQRHWRDFRADGIALSELKDETLAAQRHAHMGALLDRPWSVAILSLLIAAAGVFYFTSSLGFFFAVLPGWLWRFFQLSYGVGAVLLFWVLVLQVQRLWWHNMHTLMARSLANMLQKPDFRAWLAQTPRGKALEQRLTAWELSGWDAPDYRARYQPDATGLTRIEAQSSAELVQATLRAFLGYKDPETRKFRPGQYLDSLRQKKKSVTKFIKQHQEKINQNKQGLLPADEGLAMLRDLHDTYLVEDSSGAQKLRAVIEALERGDTLVDNQLEASIWQRDPWIDLTHQMEFYSSASLRGEQWMGRDSTGRLGTFGYLHNPCISALDFRTTKGRLVRARIAIAQSPTPTQPERVILFVDGVEGSNAIAPSVIQQAIEDYARTVGVDAVFYSDEARNTIPRRFLRHLSSQGLPLEAWQIEYADTTTREYLDSFGLPLRPFEYATPRGTVLGYATQLGPKPEPPTLPTFSLRLRSLLKRNILWLLVSWCLLFASGTLWLSAPWLLLPFLLLCTLGITLHLAYQRKSLQPSP